MNPVWHFVNGVPTGGVLRPSVTLAGDGSASAPSYSFASDPDTGFYRGDSGKTVLVSNATAAFTFGSPADAYRLSFGDDVVMTRDGAANILAQRNGAATQVFRVGPATGYAVIGNAGLGYAAGLGGTVTQLTSKATGVTLNTVTGEITMNAAALAASASVTFALTDSAIAATDYVMVQHVSAGTLGAYVTQAVAAAGSASITVTNRSGGSLSEAIVIKFVVFKAVTS